MDASNKMRAVRRYLGLLDEHRWSRIRTVPSDRIGVLTCDYKQGREFPDLTQMTRLSSDYTWGSGQDTHAWFSFTVPAKDIVGNTFLHVATDRGGWDADNPQFIVYVNGETRQGLDTNHTEVLLKPGCDAEVLLYGYTGPRITSTKIFVDTRVLDEEINHLYYDILYPCDMLSYLSEESYEYAQILDILYHTVECLDLYDMSSDGFADSVRSAQAYITEKLYTDFCEDSKTKTVCIGHTHIDCAWLWSLRQTREKVQRSFATVLELMNRYPEYKFMSSQALLYKDLKEEDPTLYEQVKKRIAEGRWECEGAMWVEADCNLSSGESLVRQVLYGKNFFRDEFGVENRVLWLPDVFGYSAALPQILKKSGVDWFVTSKISWNDTNTMPYDTFMWKGLDGTEINAHFLTAQDAGRGPSGRGTTYVANTGARMIAGAFKRYKQKDVFNEAIVTFGYGDGGGGPTDRMLELARRGACGISGSPKVSIEFAGDFLKRLEERMRDNDNVPVWNGELYLEFHRGTYTSQARNKRNNRKSEFLLEKAETLAVIENRLIGKAFPKSQLHDSWESVLTHQFHDIIPGSSIHEVYEESDSAYAEILATGNAIADGALEAIAARLPADDGLLVYNPHSFTASAPVSYNGRSFVAKDVPPKGYRIIPKSEIAANNGNHIRADLEARTVETDSLLVRFDEAWQLISIVDKASDRELTSGPCNELRVYADYPDTYDAWEWQAYERAKYTALTDVQSVSLADDGCRLGIRISRRYMGSTLDQTVWFTDNGLRIDFETSIDWQCRHQMLKAAFPVAIHSDKATYDVQFGTVERPTHFNTSWDIARFEVCGHKFADLSEHDYGIALMNDCKYGYDIHDSVMQLSLLRGATYPDETADVGKQVFTYSLFAHASSYADSRVIPESYLLNNPLTAVDCRGTEQTLPARYSLLEVEGDAQNRIICETVKQAEYSDAVIVRMYQAQNRRETAHIKLNMPGADVSLCDMSENVIEPVKTVNGAFDYTFKPFEIVTFAIS